MAEMYNEQRVLGVRVLEGGGGGGAQDVNVTNTSIPVTGPLTNAQLTALVGATSAAAYADPTGAAVGTMIGLLKGIFVQLAEINAKTPPAP